MKSLLNNQCQYLKVLGLLVTFYFGSTDGQQDGKLSSTAPVEKEIDPRLSAPWVASIFLKNPSNGLWELICGGTITSSHTVITSARCITPRVAGDKFSSRPYHYNYKNLQVVAGLKTSNYDVKDEFTQYSTVGQVRDLLSRNEFNGDTPHKDLAALRLKRPFNLSTPYVKEIVLTEQVETILEINATKPGSRVMVAGFDFSDTTSGVKTRSKSITSLKLFEISLIDVSTCLDRYTESYQAYYFDVLCGISVSKVSIPCHLEGAGLIIKATIKIHNDTKPLENFYLMGVYSSNTALAKTEGTITTKNSIAPLPCSSDDTIFFTKLGYLGRWGISHNFCDIDLAMCQNNKCRPWSDLCNGQSECEDGSDESSKICFNQICSSNQFKCKYGGCVDKNKTCDGVIDCKDGTDEDGLNVCKGKTTAGGTGDQTIRIKEITCKGIPEQKDVNVKCLLPDAKTSISCQGNVPVGSSLVLKRNEIRATCTKEGIWSLNVVLSNTC